LGGDGGDELFGGYLHYDRLLKMQRTFARLPAPARVPVAMAAPVLLPLGFKGRNWLQGLGVDLGHGLPLIAAYFDVRSRRSLMPQKDAWPLIAEAVRERAIPLNKDLLQRATRSDFESYLTEDILVKVDRASMLNSLEVRAPLLDYRVIEFAFGKVPSQLKTTSTDRKILLKKLAARILPPQFDRQRKQGFSIPLASWLRQGPWRQFFRDVLLSSNGGLFNRKALAGVLDGQARGRSNAERLFALVMLELWRREYRL
jgi:asparagine synthase (glutamine-hydrolysing)